LIFLGKTLLLTLNMYGMSSTEMPAKLVFVPYPSPQVASAQNGNANWMKLVFLLLTLCVAKDFLQLAFLMQTMLQAKL